MRRENRKKLQGVLVLPFLRLETSQLERLPQNPIDPILVPLSLDERGLLVKDLERIRNETKDIRK